jgi:hypothetical protein
MKARLGMTSIVLGVLSIAMVYAANHYESFRGTGSSYLLNAADRAGLVRTSPVDAPVELKAPGLLAFTAGSFVSWGLAGRSINLPCTLCRVSSRKQLVSQRRLHLRLGWAIPDEPCYRSLVYGCLCSRFSGASSCAQGLTPQSRGRPQAGFAHMRPPLTSNVRRHEIRPHAVPAIESNQFAA